MSEQLHPFYVAGLRAAADLARRTASSLPAKAGEMGEFSGRTMNAAMGALRAFADAIESELEHESQLASSPPPIAAPTPARDLVAASPSPTRAEVRGQAVARGYTGDECAD